MKNLSKLLIFVVVSVALCSSYGFVSTNPSSDSPVRDSGYPLLKPEISKNQNPAGSIGPAPFPPGINPLTGLAVSDPANLALPPVLISITNFPASSRPQAGLSYSPLVYEMFVGEGECRFLAVFYGDYPEQAGTINTTSPFLPTQIPPEEKTGFPKITSLDGEAVIGPIRSGRLAYESLRVLNNGMLVMASGHSLVTPKLNQYINIFGVDTGNINSAMIRVSQIKTIAQKSQKIMDSAMLGPNRFDNAVPEGGRDASAVWIPFALLNQVWWRYDPASGAYLRYQDNADGKNFVLDSDRLNGETLTYENIILLFANHKVYAPTLMDVDLLYQNRTPALLFRDGKMYKIFWTTRSEEYEQTTGHLRPIRFVDAQGQPFPLKQGQTWITIMPLYSQYDYYETIDDPDYIRKTITRQPGSGIWAARFFPPEINQ